MKRGDTFPHPTDGEPVRVMAIADGWAMVRRPGCLPFVIMDKEAERLKAEELTSQRQSTEKALPYEKAK